MKKLTKFFAIFAGAAMLASGMAALSHTHNEVKMEAVKAEAAVNATYKEIYNDDWNNTAAGAAGYNKLLIVYTGTAHNHPAVIAGAELQAYDEYVTINGKPFSSYSGQHNQIAPWDGQFWIQIIYQEDIISVGSILTIKEGCQIGDAVFETISFRLNSNNKWEYHFTDEVNSTYNGIYNDDYNNTAVNENYNKVLVKYTGVAHGLTDPIAGTLALKKYDGYIFIDGKPLSYYLSVAGGLTQIAPWGGQPWFQFLYPASVVTTGSIFEVKDGCKIGNAVLAGFTLKLNANSKWEQISYIKDEELVKNNDFTLFTISDYKFNVNDAGGYVFYPASGNITAMSGSFGFRFKVNFPTGTTATSSAVLRFAGTDIYGSGAPIKITINYSANTYLTFNGAVDYCYASYPNPVWTENVDRVVEFYFIRTNETTGYVLFGVDGIMIWKTGAKDTTGVTFNNFFTTTGTANTASYYSSDSSVVDEGVARFNQRALHSEDINASNVSDTGACKGANGYYAKAKAYYGAYLTNAQKALFATAEKYGNARARFAAWGAANGEDVAYNATGATFSATADLLDNVEDENKGFIVVIISSITIVLSLSLFFVIKRKKQLR